MGGFFPFGQAGGASVAATLPWFNVNQFGADPTGVRDSTAAFTAAYAAAAATLATAVPGAYVTMGPGTYRVTAGACIASSPKIGLLGPGAGICQVNAHGAGDVFYHYDANFPTGSHEGNIGLEIGGFTVDGTSTSGPANGLHVRDICELALNDLQFQNFTIAGSAGEYFDGLNGWSERLMFLRVRTSNCAIGTRFTSTVQEGGTSYDYMRCLSLYANIFPGQIGVQLDSFAQLDQATFFYSYNCNAQGAGADQTALMIGPTDPSTETSRIINALFDIRGEKDGSGSNCFDLHIGAWANLTGTGVLLGSGMDAGAINSGSVYISGYINTPAFPSSEVQFTLPGGGAAQLYGGTPSFSANTKLFPNTPGARGLTLLDTTSGAVRSTVLSGAGNPAGVYFSNLSGDLLVRQDSLAVPNGQLFLATGTGTGTWQPVVAAAIASGQVTLVAGSSGAIANASITANSIIRCFNITAGGTVGALSVTKVAGVSFTIHSSSGADTSTVYWEVVSY